MSDSFKSNWVISYEHEEWDFIVDRVQHIRKNVRDDKNPTKEICYVYLGVRRHSMKLDDDSEKQTWLIMVRQSILSYMALRILTFIWILNYIIFYLDKKI